MRRNTVAVLVVLSLITAACGKEATGQVAAIVNGEEVTLQEINAELAGMALPEGADREAAQAAALQRIIDRRLMAQEAQEEGLDQTPDYLMRQRQLSEALLVQLISQTAERSLAVPDQQALDEYIAQNPVLFGNRKIYTMDRIRFPVPADFERLTVLEDDHSMTAVAASLNGLNIEFQRDTAELDSAQLGAERLERIQALPDGEPFIVTEGGAVVVGVLTGSRDAPMSADQARPFALQVMRREQLTNSLKQRLERARTTAEIEYQERFKPEAAKTPASSTPAAN